MNIFAYPYELVEHAKSSDDRRLFAIPGSREGVTYAEAKVYLEDRNCRIEEPTVTPTFRRNTARIASQLGGMQEIIRKNTRNDEWRK